VRSVYRGSHAGVIRYRTVVAKMLRTSRRHPLDGKCDLNSSDNSRRAKLNRKEERREPLRRESVTYVPGPCIRVVVASGDLTSISSRRRVIPS
jgi:hypothetical protein